MSIFIWPNASASGSIDTSSAEWPVAACESVSNVNFCATTCREVVVLLNEIADLRAQLEALEAENAALSAMIGET